MITMLEFFVIGIIINKCYLNYNLGKFIATETNSKSATLSTSISTFIE